MNFEKIKTYPGLIASFLFGGKGAKKVSIEIVDEWKKSVLSDLRNGAMTSQRSIGDSGVYGFKLADGSIQINVCIGGYQTYHYS